MRLELSLTHHKFQFYTQGPFLQRVNTGLSTSGVITLWEPIGGPGRTSFSNACSYASLAFHAYPIYVKENAARLI